MCTAISMKTKDHYFGRNLDLEYRYHEAVTITPRSYPFHFCNGLQLDDHFAIIGIATISQDYPLYYEATNEMGLSIAGLNFPNNAAYFPFANGATNIAPYEFVPWVLSQYSTVDEAMNSLQKLNLWSKPFSDAFPVSPLHWLMADRNQCVTIESTTKGLHIYENPIGVLTNSPPFEYHMYNLSNYINVSPLPPENRFALKLELTPFSLGMGAIGLPGDPSSPSRFVRAAFTKWNSVSGNSEEESISQFFHVLGSVAQQRGITNVKDEAYEFTLYSSCCNTDKGIFYYTTYENSQVTAVDMHKEDLTGCHLISYPIVTNQQIFYQN